MDGVFAGSKKIEIDGPENISQETANRCFMMGLHDLICVNNGGITVNFGVENGNGSILIQSMSFKDDYAVAIKKFCEAVMMCANKNTPEENLGAYRDVGKKILEDLENGNL